VLRLAQQKQREGAGIPGGCSSPAKGWARTWRLALPLAQSSPPGNEDQARRVREKGKGKKQRGEGLSTSQARAGLPPQAGVRHNPEPRRYEAEIPPTLPPSSNSFLFLKEMLNFQKKRSSNSVRDRPFGCLC